jgi:hypothetical protein
VLRSVQGYGQSGGGWLYPGSGATGDTRPVLVPAAPHASSNGDADAGAVPADGTPAPTANGAHLLPQAMHTLGRASEVVEVVSSSCAGAGGAWGGLAKSTLVPQVMRVLPRSCAPVSQQKLAAAGAAPWCEFVRAPCSRLSTAGVSGAEADEDPDGEFTPLNRQPPSSGLRIINVGVSGPG